MTEDRLEALEQRRVDNIGEQIDNASLPAGSPMFYYCRCCGLHVATLPESWYEKPPPKACAECAALLTDGIEIDNYDDWLKARGEKPVPR